MAVAEEKVAEGVRLQQAGRLAEAETLFREVVAADPTDYNAAFRLAVLYMHAGRNDEAAAAYQRLIAQDPRNASALANFGTVLQALGRVDEAERRYREAVVANPALSAAQANLAVLLEHQGRLDDAIDAYRALLRIDPEDMRALPRLPALLLSRDRVAEALPLLQRWHELEPDNPHLAFLWGAVHLMRGAPDDAVPFLERAATAAPKTTAATLARALAASRRPLDALAWFDTALAAAPKDANLLADKAAALLAAGRREAAEATAVTAIELQRNQAAARAVLGQLRQSEFRHAAALAEFDFALAARPNDAALWANRGASLQALGRTAEALKAYDVAVERAPRNGDNWFNYGTVLQAAGRFDEARSAFRRAREHKPNLASIDAHLLHMQLKVCDWRELPETNARLVAATRSELQDGKASTAPPFALYGAEAPFALKMAATRSYAATITQTAEPARQRLAFRYAARTDKLRIGYLSPDFRGHSAGRLFETLLRYHDRSRYALHGYSLTSAATHDAATAGFADAFDAFHDVHRLGHEDAARRIHADGIHVLVDLASYTRGARPEILALRPAPVQCHYLGYNLPLGADWCPYLIGDPVSFADPAIRAALPARLVLLEGPWVAAEPQPPVQPMSRGEAGLPPDAFVLANFSAPQKLEPILWGAWMRILRAVPHAVLWMLDAGDSVRRNLLREASQYGVGAQRIVWAPPLKHADHVRRLACADLSLDTYTYKGGATALESLAAGVPVLTLQNPGPAWVASLATAAGTPETIACDVTDYERVAINLAAEPTVLARLRTQLQAARGTAAFQPARWARDVERAYETMWREYESGISPTV